MSVMARGIFRLEELAKRLNGFVEQVGNCTGTTIDKHNPDVALSRFQEGTTKMPEYQRDGLIERIFAERGINASPDVLNGQFLQQGESSEDLQRPERQLEGEEALKERYGPAPYTPCCAWGQ